MKATHTLLPGEIPMPQAPQIKLDDGTNCIPQHYLSYHHTKSSVQDIVADIDYDPHYLLFADEDQGGIFIQVGIVGLDNYISKHFQAHQKIVYGRRWRVEPNLPSSEIIQTCFLALMKAREHEIRELVKLHQKGKTTTPFSCHHDLPLMAMSSKTQANNDDALLSKEKLKALIEQLSFDDGSFSLLDTIELANRQFVIGLQFLPSEKTKQPDLSESFTMNLLVDEMNQNAVLYAVIDALLHRSNRHVEENFTFKQFARFSRSNSVLKIADLSAQTRHKGVTEGNEDFRAAFTQSNYETDETRVPSLPKEKHGKLGVKLSAQLNRFKIGGGILPK